jgi:hypothetical protein
MPPIRVCPVLQIRSNPDLHLLPQALYVTLNNGNVLRLSHRHLKVAAPNLNVISVLR